MKDKKGFTLVELLGTIAIVGIVVMIAIPSVSNYQKKANEQWKETTLKSIKSATESYLLDHGDNYNSGYYGFINISDIIQEGYLNNIKDSLTHKDCDGYVGVKYNGNDSEFNNKYNYDIDVNLICGDEIISHSNVEKFIYDYKIKSVDYLNDIVKMEYYDNNNNKISDDKIEEQKIKHITKQIKINKVYEIYNYDTFNVIYTDNSGKKTSQVFDILYPSKPTYTYYIIDNNKKVYIDISNSSISENGIEYKEIASGTYKTFTISNPVVYMEVGPYSYGGKEFYCAPYDSNEEEDLNLGTCNMEYIANEDVYKISFLKGEAFKPKSPAWGHYCCNYGYIEGFIGLQPKEEESIEEMFYISAAGGLNDNDISECENNGCDYCVD